MVKARRSAGLIVLGGLLLAGCGNVPGADGRYATPGRGGWDSFRAEAPGGPKGASDDNFRAEVVPRGDAVRPPDM
jgi:hypothetical protein